MTGLFGGEACFERALDVTWLRQQCVSNNLANVGNKNYCAQQVTGFESMMRSAMDKQQSGDDALAQEGDDDIATLHPTVETASRPGVDMNEQMTNLARLQIMYEALTQQVKGDFSDMKYVVDNSGR